MHIRVFLTVVLAIMHLWLRAQITIGLPEISNYSKQVYKGGAQTRQIVQDKNGVLYFANDEGLLTFNGVHWKIYPLPNKSLVRCLKFGPDGNLYVGGQDEFGYFAPSVNGSLQYHSLKDYLPAEARSFADVWEICFAGRSIFFQTIDRIYQLTGKKVTVHADPHWRFMGKSGNELFAQSGKKGLLWFKNDRWEPFLDATKWLLPADYFVTSLTSIGNDSTLLTTLKNGIYLIRGKEISPWTLPGLTEVTTKNVSSSFMVNRNQIAIGTNLDGCFIFEKTGQLVQHFGRKEGMQDNNILVIFLDREKNLWFGLHNGIDFIPYNNAVRHINPASLNGGAGYTSQVFENDLYIGTSIGLYKFPIGANKDFSSIRAAAVPVRGTTGEVWNLSTVAGHLLMGHNEGAFSIQGDQAIPIDKTNGYWNFQLLSSTISPSLMIAGTYKGLAFYAYQNETFTKMPGDAEVESARFVIPENDRVWFSHPYKGIYAVSVKDGVTAVKKYTAKEGVASVNNNYLFKIKNTLLLTTEKGMFAYRPGKDIFEPSDFYNTYLPRVPIRYMKEDAQGNIWFVFEKKVAVLDLSTGRPHVIYLPELTNKLVAGFEHINPVDENNILLGGEKGFYNVNYQQYKQLKYPLQLLIGSVTEINHGDSLLFGGYDASVSGSKNRQQQPLILNHAFNSLHFEYASPVYGQLSNIEYSYYLEGFDNGWSDFSQKTEKDYTNLSPGDYVFKVKARSNLGNESAINEYRFTVLPPWYRTNAAYLFYVILIGIGLYFFVRFQQRKFLAQQRRHDEEQRKLQYLHQLELEKAEKELVELRNQKLEAEILNKNTELASTAMHLVQKSDVLHKIKEQMSRLKEGTASEEATGDFRKILRTLNEENKIEEQWQQFSQHFDSVHHNFLSTLKKKYPGLTPNEQKLCAYLKLNLSTKEIAQLMNISVRGVEISRYRLRKKLGIPAGMHLFNFLDEVG